MCLFFSYFLGMFWALLNASLFFLFTNSGVKLQTSQSFNTLPQITQNPCWLAWTGSALFPTHLTPTGFWMFFLARVVEVGALSLVT